MTIAEARAALIAALRDDAPAAWPVTDTPGTIAAPYLAVLGGGADLGGRIVTGRIAATFRVAMIAGAADQSAAVAELDAMKQAVMSALRALAGWQLGELRPDGIRTFAGADFLTADLEAVTLVTL